MSLTTNKNYLQPTGFKCVIDRRNYPNLEFFVQGVTHPGATVNPVELPTSRVTSIPMAGDKITYTNLELEIILDEDMESYQEIQNWMNRIVNDGHKAETKGDDIGTYADITILIMSSHNNKNVQIRYKDCVPVDIGSLILSSTAADVTYLTFNTSFRFAEFEIS